MGKEEEEGCAWSAACFLVVLCKGERSTWLLFKCDEGGLGGAMTFVEEGREGGDISQSI